GHYRGRIWSDDHVAAGNVEVIRKRERDRAAGLGATEIAIEGHDPRYSGVLSGACDHYLVAGRDRATRDVARIPAEIPARAVHALHPKAQGRVTPRRNLDALQPSQHRLTSVPGHPCALAHNIVAIGRDCGNGIGRKSESRRERPEFVADRGEAGFGETDESHLV